MLWQRRASTFLFETANWRSCCKGVWVVTEKRWWSWTCHPPQNLLTKHYALFVLRRALTKLNLAGRKRTLLHQTQSDHRQPPVAAQGAARAIAALDQGCLATRNDNAGNYTVLLDWQGIGNLALPTHNCSRAPKCMIWSVYFFEKL